MGGVQRYRGLLGYRIRKKMAAFFQKKHHTCPQDITGIAAAERLFFPGLPTDICSGGENAV